MSTKKLEIVDPYGRTLDRHAFAYYKGAEAGRLHGSWNAPRKSADAALLPDRWTVIARTRERAANDPMIKGWLKRLTDNVIGKGLRVESQINYERIGISAQQANDIEREQDHIWDQWCEEFDYSGNEARRFTFNEAQRTWYMAEKVDGENFIISRYEGRPGYRFKYCLQTIASDRIRNPETQNISPNVDIRDGVEIGRRGEIVRIWVANQHPGDTGFRNNRRFIDYSPVQAVNRAGRANFWHNFTWYMPEATRGEPGFAAVLIGARHFADYLGHELVRAEMAANMGLIFTRDQQFGEDAGLDEGDRIGDERERHYRQFEMYPGMWYMGYPGDDVQTVNPNLPGNAFEPFTDKVPTLTSFPLGLSREQAINSWSGMSFSAAKASKEEVQRGFACEQYRFAGRYILLPRARVIEEAWMRGGLIMPGFEDPSIRREYLRSMVYPQPWGGLEPVKDETARDMRIKNRTSTYQIEMSEKGHNWRNVMAQQAKEQLEAKRLGLPDPYPEDPKMAEPPLDQAASNTPNDGSRTQASRYAGYERALKISDSGVCPSCGDEKGEEDAA